MRESGPPVLDFSVKTMCFPDEILERIFDFLSSHQDRNSVSVVCKTWFNVERWSRHRVFVGNCYAMGPKRVIERFPRLGSLSLKGRPHFDGLPHDWGGSAQGWIAALAESCPCLEELKLKRMVVSDDSLVLLSRSFPNFKALVLFGCWGFTTDGLAAIGANCRILRELDLQESKVDDHGGNWLSCFPDSFTSLVSLNIAACLGGEVNFGTLERLVARCPDLRSLRLNVTVSLQALLRILAQAPQLEDLGTGTFVDNQPLPIANFLKCKFVKSLSGYWGVTPNLLGFIHTMCSNNLTSLNLSYAPSIEGYRFVKLIQKCCKLEHLWVLDCIGDKGLRAVSSNCKELQELRVFSSNRFFARRNAASAVTEDGLVSVSDGCPKLHSLLYFCRQMTNAALFTVARNCPHLTHFRLCIQYPRKADPVMHQPLDEGFGAIVRSCKHLKRLSLSGLLTDQVFLYIGMYAEQLEILSVAFAGGSDNGMIYVLNGCRKLRKLEIRDCRFGDSALLTDVGKYERMRSLWMSSCDITLRGCKLLAQKMPRLNVEIINDRKTGGLNFKDENPDDDRKVEKMYLYRSLDGPRKDVPHYVWTL